MVQQKLDGATIDRLLQEGLQEGHITEMIAAVTELHNGRLMPLPDTKEINKQLDPNTHDVMDPTLRKDKRVVVDPQSEDYGRVMDVNPNSERDGVGENTRIEKVTRIALALQKLIRDRAVSWTFGIPVQLNCKPENDTQKQVFDALKRIYYDVKINTINRKVARHLYGNTEVAEYWYPVSTEKHTLYGFETPVKFKVAIFSPAYGDTLYPYFDANRDLIAFSREFTRKDNDLQTRSYFETWTAEWHYLWSSDATQAGAKTNNWQIVDGYPVQNAIGKIPVIYGSQPEPEWQCVQGLIDRLEKLLSNFGDTNDYHASPKIFVKGHIVGFARKGDAGGIIEGDDGAEAQYLSWANAPESVKLEIETLLRMIYTLTRTPDISWEGVKSLGNISGVALKLLFMDADLKVQDKCEIWDDYLPRRNNVVKAYLKIANLKQQGWQDAADQLMIEPIVTPYTIEDEDGKVSRLTAANGGKAIASRRTTIAKLGWVDDADQELSDIETEEAAERSATQGEFTI